MEQTVGKLPFHTCALRDELIYDKTEHFAFRPVHSSGSEGTNRALAGHFGQVGSGRGWTGLTGLGAVS
jgi:hypothetical protein